MSPEVVFLDFRSVFINIIIYALQLFIPSTKLLYEGRVKSESKRSRRSSYNRLRQGISYTDRNKLMVTYSEIDSVLTLPDEACLGIHEKKSSIIP
jgi:hypothetical protein